MTDQTQAAARNADSLAIVLIAVALIVFLGASLFDLHRSNVALQKADTEQSAALTTANRPVAQLNALAHGVQQLADGGDANAATVVATLQANGVHISADGEVSIGKPDK